MTQRVGMLNGNNINHDKDFTAGLLAMLNAGVIEGLAVSGSGASANITAGKALIECIRTNGENVMVFFENTANVAVDLTGTKKVYILVDQGKLDDGSSNAEDGTGVASIQTGANWPSGSYIKVCSTASGVVKDEREFTTMKHGAIKDTSWKLVTGSGSGWTRIGRFVGEQSARLLIGYIGGNGFSSGSNGATSVGKIGLTIGNASGVKNLSGQWINDFGSTPINIIRVQRVNGDPYTWDIFIYHAGTYINSTFFEISHSGTSFIPFFDATGASNIDEPNGIYDIPQYVPGLSIIGLTELTTTASGDFFIIYDSVGGSNKKISRVNARKAINPLQVFSSVSSSASTPGGSWSYGTSVFSERGNIDYSISVSTGGSNNGPTPIAKVQVSRDNTNWTDLASVTCNFFNQSASATKTYGFVDGGVYIRSATLAQGGYSTANATITITT